MGKVFTIGYAGIGGFKSGVARVREMIERGNVCLMCAEIDPMNCHRAHLCGRWLCEAGMDVVHIIARRNGEVTYETQPEFNGRVLELYKKQTGDLQVAFKIHNEKIGFKWQ